MENIINLVKSLQTGEIKLMRHFYRFQEDNDCKKINLLFDFAVKSKKCKKPDELDKKAFGILYNNNRKDEISFAKLKFRLKNDILNILLLQASAMKFKARHDVAIFDCRRMLIQGEILLGRGIYNEGISILERASAIARKNELFAEQILIDELCRNYNLLKPGEQAFTAFMKRIEANTSLLERVQFAKHFHYEMTASRLFKNKNTLSIEACKNKLDIIKRDYDQTKSVKIGFYYNLSALNYYREIYRFDKSLEFGLVLQKNIESYEILNTTFYSGKINMELAKCYLLTEDIEKAIYYANVSIHYFQKDVLNELSSLEILMHCYLIRQDYKKVGLILETALLKVNTQPDEFIYSKWCFLKAGIEFRAGEYTNSLQSLKKCNELLKDKNGWLIAFSLFEAICRIENGHLEWFEYRAEALRKIILRYNKGRDSRQNRRFDLTYLILRTLHKNNYDYVQTIEDEKENLNYLSGISYSCSWYMNGYEPIAFDEWLKEKAANQLKNKKTKSKLVA